VADTLTLNKKSGDKVAVGCKLPHGIVLRLYKPTSQNDSNGKEITVFVADGDPVTLNGTNADKKGGRVVGGYGLTENVDADFMDAWMTQNPNFPAVKNGLIFVAPRVDKARDQAKEQTEVRGIETIDPEHPERHNGPDTPSVVRADNYEGAPDRGD
jgi:hypothetical protein